MTCVLAILALLLAGAALFSLLRIRVRAELGTDVRYVFVGLGRSGARLDFVGRRREYRLFGLTVKRRSLDREKPPAEKKAAKSREPEKPAKEKRPVPWRDILQLVPQVGRALRDYLIGLARSLIVEQLEAEIEAGFDQPDLTGKAFGYYQAALAAAPGVVGRLQYRPVWDRAAFSGSGRVTVALPLYRLLGRTAQFIWRLPLRALWKITIGSKRGDRNEQRQ
jgi:hypothetical protein